MSLYAAGVDLDKACVLIALERQFGYVDEFLIDYFLEFGENGFDSNHFYLIAESMPAIILQRGFFTIHYKQSEPYLIVYDRNNNVRYRIATNRLITLVYVSKDDDAPGHAVALFASEMTYYLRKEKFIAMILPNDVFVDYRTYDQDIEADIIT